MRSLSRPWAMVIVALAMLGGVLVATPAQAAGTGSITGKVLATIGNTTTAHADAQIGLARYLDDEHFETGEEVWATSDVQGNFSFDQLDDGWYAMRILPSADGQQAGLGSEHYNNKWSPYGEEAIHVTGGQVSLPEIVLEQVGWITGTVRDAEGNPMPNAWVTVRDAETSGSYGLPADNNGHFDTRDSALTDNLIPGSYIVEATPDWKSDDEQGYYPDTATVWVAPSQAAMQDFVIEPQRTAVFTLLDTDGTPLADAPLQLLLQRTPGGPWESPQYGPIQTDAQGRYFFYETTNFKIKFLPPEGYTGTGVPEYWDGPSRDGAYALEDAATLTWDGQPMLRRYTVRLGTAPTIEPGTPTIAGEMKVGQTLTADPGIWAPSGVALEYQWLSGGNPIAGATERQYTIPAPLKGTYSISVRVTGRKAGEVPVEADSDYLVGPVADGPAPVEFDIPTISGTPRVDTTLTAEPGDWGPAGVDLTYVWRADNSTVGSDQPTYQPTAADLGKTITVTVSGALGGYTSVTRTSAPTAAVIAAPAEEVVPGAPTITGVARAGETLTLDSGAWLPEDVELTYQWLADGVQIDGATGTSLKLTNALAGKRISVRVTGINADQSAEAVSPATSTVVGVLSSAKPKIKGKTKVGKKLKAKPGSWGPGKVTLTYQWLRNGKAIKGANGKKHKLTKKDKGKKIQVRVTGTRTHFVTTTKTSKKTAKVKR